MARLFASASSQQLTLASAILTGPPLTFACWYRPTTSAAQQTFVSVQDASSAANFHDLSMGATGHIQARSFDTGANLFTAVSTGAVTNGTWAHAACTMSTLSNRVAYLNGVAGTADTNTSAAAGLVITRVGGQGSGNFTNGDLAEVGIWNVVLTQNEITALSAGVPPWLVRPSSLLAYWQLPGNDSPEPDWNLLTAHNALTLSNAPTLSNSNPPVVAGNFGVPTPSGYHGDGNIIGNQFNKSLTASLSFTGMTPTFNFNRAVTLAASLSFAGSLVPQIFHQRLSWFLHRFDLKARKEESR